MTQYDRFLNFLSEELMRKKNSVEFFESGQGSSHWMRDGVMTDTTIESVKKLKVHIAELEELLALPNNAPNS